MDGWMDGWWLTVRSVDKDIVVRLKWGETEYKGRLVSVDGYMNIQLSGAEEWVDQKKTGDLGQVLIRCVPPSASCSPSLPPLSSLRAVGYLINGRRAFGLASGRDVELTRVGVTTFCG